MDVRVALLFGEDTVNKKEEKKFICCIFGDRREDKILIGVTDLTKGKTSLIDLLS